MKPWEECSVTKTTQNNTTMVLIKSHESLLKIKQETQGNSVKFFMLSSINAIP